MNNQAPHSLDDSSEVVRAHRAIETLGRLVELFGLRRRQLAAEVELTDPQWEVLEQISSEHFMPSMFARQRESSAAAVSKLIRQLIDKGLVSVEVSPRDARQRDYSLTESGQQVMATLRNRRQHAIETVWLEFPPTELNRFIEFGETLITRLEALSEAGPADTRASSSIPLGKKTTSAR